MSEWKKVKLGDVCEIFAGGDKPKIFSENRTDKCRVPVYSNGIDYEGLYGFTDVAKSKGNAITITGRGANAGTVFYRKEPFTPIIRLLTLNPNNEVLDAQYLYYLLKEKTFLSTGSAQPQITVPNIAQYEIEYNPDKEIQHRIATILSRYDTLIENYQKQIKLLEEAAQRLYKEWFVDLRFPGYENAKMVDGLPEGWERKKLGEVCEVNKTSIAKNYAYNYVNYNDLGNVREGSIQEPVRYVYGQEPGRAKRVAKDGDVIWGMVRPNLKSYALVQNPKPQDVYSTGFAVLSSKAVPFSFLYCAVITDDFVGYLVNCTNGAAYPAVKAVHFENAVLLVPSRSLLDEFSKFAEPLFRKSGKLSSQIRLLAEARDRLLPKLMGGEMEVDAPKGQRATSIEQRSGHNEQTTNAPKGQKH